MISDKFLYDCSVEILENLNKRKILIDILSTSKPTQENLFGFDREESLNIILDNLLPLIKEKKPLYHKWVQKIADKERQLNVPNKVLRRFIEDYILDLVKSKNVHERCHGGEVGWSVKKSLETHLPCESTLSFDLEKAFENIPIEFVSNFFYNLLDTNLTHEEKENITRFFSMLFTVKYEDKRGLPQGSPCSMALFNRILFPLDEELYQKSREKGFKYTRWVDDFTISSSYSSIESFLGAIELTENYFSVSKEKIFFQDGDKIYLLGHKIIKGERLEKNTKEEKLKNKGPSINFYKWFDNGTKNYDSWV